MRQLSDAKPPYVGIDHFRLIAAILVVAVHTSPLLVLNETADFVLTRIVARIAVPFFFMASGFFLFREATGDLPGEPKRERLTSFLQRTAVLYGVATLLYLPVAVYAGHTSGWWYTPALLKAVLFDGTFYHLWYLPAAMLGATVVWLLRRALPDRWALGVTLLLYAVGLFGDSYYGLTEALPAAEAWYRTLFMFFDYTRNGIFMAPVFFMFGALMARQPRRMPLTGALTGLAVSALMLLGEGLLLQSLGTQRHDSMYVMLLPTMVFLFQGILHWEPRRLRFARPVALAGYTKWTSRGKSRHVQIPPARMDRAWAEIDGESLRHNAAVLRSVLPEGCQLMAVVKANAYGHGDLAVARQLEEAGVRAFAVATLDEGIGLRTGGIEGDILILGYTVPGRIREAVDHNLIQTLVDGDYARTLNAGGKPIRAHVKVDTGMHRLGVDWNRPDEAAQLFGLNRFRIEGIFTQLAAADSSAPADITFTREQIRRFDQVLTCLQERQIALPKVHLQSSYGVLNYPDVRADFARGGMALYGLLSGPQSQTNLKVDLRPVLQVKARVALVREIGAGEAVGYGGRFVAQQATRIAVVPVGYADLYPRNLSPEAGCVLIHGRRAPIVGRLCMDQLMVDVGALSHVQAGDVVTLIGRDEGEFISAEEVAAQAGTITNELLCRLGMRLERVYTHAGTKPF